LTDGALLQVTQSVVLRFQVQPHSIDCDEGRGCDTNGNPGHGVAWSYSITVVHKKCFVTLVDKQNDQKSAKTWIGLVLQVAINSNMCVNLSSL